MSIHQLIAYHTILTVFKVVKTREPVYLAERFGIGQLEQVGVRARRNQFNIRVDFDLSIGRAGFVYRGAQLWNMIPVNERTATTIRCFKSKIKPWIRQNVGILPNN